MFLTATGLMVVLGVVGLAFVVLSLAALARAVKGGR
jgi:hypothetical protein